MKNRIIGDGVAIRQQGRKSPVFSDQPNSCDRIPAFEIMCDRSAAIRKLLKQCQFNRLQLAASVEQISFTGGPVPWQGDMSCPGDVLVAVGNELAELDADTELMTRVCSAADDYTHAKAIAAFFQVEKWCRPEIKQSFVATPLQREILRVLEGRAMTKQALANKVCKGDGGAFYRKNDLPELRNLGLVVHRNRLGFYRPDAPPPSL